MPPVPLGYKYKNLQATNFEEDDGEVVEVPTLQKVVKPPPYEERLIHVLAEDNSTATVMGKCLKWLAVHKALPIDAVKGGGYTITHIYTQRHLLTLLSESDALRVAKYLEEYAGRGMRLATMTGIIHHVPEWVIPWMKAMRVKMGWVDPGTFRR